MEVSNVVPFPIQLPSYDNTSSVMDIDMDMDIDLGLDQDLSTLESEVLKAETAPSSHPPHPTSITASSSPLGPTVDLAEPEPTKVHIRGLDNLTTANIKAFASEHCHIEFVRIEWIDDTSANILYETAEAAAEALASFTENAFEATSIPPLQLRKAKALSSHPSTGLHVRQAAVGDIKKPRAREASRFYLLNPDKDPRERRRRNDRYRRDPDREYRHKRRRDEGQSPAFDVNMYDDDAGTLAVKEPGTKTGRSESFSSFDSSANNNDERNGSGRRRVRFAPRRHTDLFADRDGTGASTLRDRSASPGRGDGDGRLGFDGDGESAASARKIRRRSLTPPPPYRSRDPHPYPRDNVGKELFATASSDNAGKELFASASPTRTGATGKELFPNRTATSNHRRSDAFDAGDADEAADMFANKMSVPLVDGASDLRQRGLSKDKSRDLFSRINEGKGKAGRDLFSRVNGGPFASPSLSSLSYGRLVETNATNIKPGDAVADARESAGSEGFNIRGTASAKKQEEDIGFSIRGMSAKELFPMKSGGGAAGENQGVELFGEKIRGRGVASRKRAEDLFS